MPTLILVNGPPGCGKSTIAARYVADHPLALALDVDDVRSRIGGWRERPEEAGLLARNAVLAAAGAHLAAGHDVVVPQYLGRPAFVERLAALAAETGAEFREVVLMTSRDEALRRFRERADPAKDGTDLDAMYDRLVALLPHRPGARVISADGDADATYAAFVDALR